jgi:hypothetical protein
MIALSDSFRNSIDTRSAGVPASITFADTTLTVLTIEYTGGISFVGF